MKKVFDEEISKILKEIVDLHYKLEEIDTKYTKPKDENEAYLNFIKVFQRNKRNISNHLDFIVG